MIEWCKIVDDGLFSIDPAFCPDGEVCDRVPTVGNESGERVRVDAMLGEPLFVIADHAGEVAAGRVATDEHPFGIATILRNVLEGPSDGRGRVFNVGGGGDLGVKPIIHGHDCEAFLCQAGWH